MVLDAIHCLDPGLRNILAQRGATRDRQCVAIVVVHPNLRKPVIGLIGDGLDEWPKADVDRAIAVATQKALTAQRTGKPTSLLVSTYPDELQAGDYLWPGGVATHPGGLAVGTSGARGVTDEGISWVVFDVICMQCCQERLCLQEAGITQVA